VKPYGPAACRSARSLTGSAGAALLATAVLAGCGTQGSGAEDGPTGGSRSSGPVRASVESYFRAVDRADGRAICARLSEGLRRGVARLQSAPCERALADEARRLPESLNAYGIVRVSRTGTIATVALDQAGVRDEMRLKRGERAWRITSAPGLGQ
jgi:hypothetical protein